MLHSEVIEINEALRYGIEEFRGLLRQFNDLAFAQMQGEINSQDEHYRRKQQEQQIRKILSVYKAKGSLAFASLTSALLVKSLRQSLRA